MILFFYNENFYHSKYYLVFLNNYIDRIIIEKFLIKFIISSQS